MMKYIHESDASYFEKEEAATDMHGEGMCPVCGCCSLVEAEVVHNIFTEVELWHSGRPREKHLVCAGGCTRDQRHEA